LSKNQKDWNCIQIEKMKIQGQDVVADLGFENRDQAIESKGQILAVDRQQLPQLEENEYYWDDLIGLNVFDLQHNDLGKVIELIETGANDVLVVSGEKERLIPYIPQVIVKIDLTEKRIEVDWDKEF